jgi:hypothetical protein
MSKYAFASPANRKVIPRDEGPYSLRKREVFLPNFRLVPDAQVPENGRIPGPSTALTSKNLRATEGHAGTGRFFLCLFGSQC